MRASTWLRCVGYSVVVIALLLLLRVGDLLPFDLSLWFQVLWSGASTPRYMRVVPTRESSMLAWGLLAFGLILIATGWALKPKREEK